MQRRSPEQFERAGRAGGGGERTDSWEVAHLDQRDNPESHRARSGRRDGEGDRVRAPPTGRGGSQVCERRGPRPSLPRIDIAAQSAEDFVLLTDLLLQLRFRPLTLELLGLGPGRTALNLDSSPQ
jgi:hypothetical protein